jgi:hypothetical protein
MSMRSWIALAAFSAIGSAGCASQPLPTQPSGVAPVPTRQIAIEAESGSGEGQIRQRSRASGGLTLHLAPGERHQWVFPLNAEPARYAVAVTYANGQEGPNELLTLSIDGAAVRSWMNRDSGDAIEGWNLFVTDSAGSSMLTFGTHSLVLESSGGDGCVEIDRITLTPD